MYPKSDVRYTLPRFVIQALQADGGSSHYKSNDLDIYLLLAADKELDLDKVIGYARTALRDAGFVTNNRGIWKLTEKGQNLKSINLDEVWNAYGQNRVLRMEKRKK